MIRETRGGTRTIMATIARAKTIKTRRNGRRIENIDKHDRVVGERSFFRINYKTY